MNDQENGTDVTVDENVPEHDREADVVVEEPVIEGRDYRVEGNDVGGYLGVSPEYMTYANDTEKPLLTDQEKWDYTNQLDHLEGNADEEVESEKSDETEETGEPIDPEVEDQQVGEDSEKQAPVSVSPVIVS